mgnify:CR=1 FL=1
MGSSVFQWSLTEQNTAEFTYLESVSSTNSWLRDRAEVVPYDLVLTMKQEKGRGRLNRQWLNLPGEGLAFSFIAPSHAKFDLAIGSSNRLPLLVGASVVRAIHSIGIPGAVMKWPNDILVGEKKLGGILCEARPDGLVIAGVGINVEFAGRLPASNAVPLRKFLQEPSAHLDGLVAGSIKNLKSIIVASVGDQIEFITSFLGTLGKLVKIDKGRGHIVRGVASGIGQDGSLILKLDNGQKESIVFGDVIHLRQ